MKQILTSTVFRPGCTGAPGNILPRFDWNAQLLAQLTKSHSWFLHNSDLPLKMSERNSSSSIGLEQLYIPYTFESKPSIPTKAAELLWHSWYRLNQVPCTFKLGPAIDGIDRDMPSSWKLLFASTAISCADDPI